MLKLIVFTILISSPILNQANAFESNVTCNSRVQSLMGDRFAIQAVNATVYRAANSALQHFHQTTKAEGVITRYVAYFQIEKGSVTGYRFTIQARDQSVATSVNYFQDSGKKLVYAKALNPSKTYWFCDAN